ncbi:MAG: hypothetical protein AAF611_19055 [Bacteroidota bacterium]
MKTIEKKEPYLHTLNTRGNIYEEFLPDQVLTHKNLNKVVNYFEDQDRQSRVYLIGVGVGCGLNIVSYSNSFIEIGQGVGITTDGDLIKSETRRFHYYSALTDRASYALFEGLQVYEIYEQEEAGRPTDELPLSSFTFNEPGALKDYILVAYVEDYSEDEGLCGGSGCDETGNKVYSNLKFLLIHKSNKTALVARDTIYNSHDVLAYYDTLPELCMPRLLLTKDNTLSGIDIHDQFTKSFALKNDLYTGITTIIDRFDHRINFARYGVTIPQITAYFDDIFVVQEEPFIQYKYDLMKDLIDTYREIRELILFTRFECVANIKAFPKHLLLGTLDEATRLQHRHEFYPSPTVSENDDNLMAIKALCIKFFNQLKEYKIPQVSSAAIKVTPSKNYEYKLSERSIPYYYETKNSLISNWNPLAIQLRKLKKHLGYHVANLQNIPCVQRPLEYSHLDKDFYRIEGHIGKDFRLALGRINKLKSQYNLAFDVKAVSIGFPVNKVSLDDDVCNTKDHAILLETWEQEFDCVSQSAMEFFSKYQLDDLGNNDTSTAAFAVASQQQEQQQVLSLLRRGDTTDETINPEKIAGRTINTNMEFMELGESVESVPYNKSIQYAIDLAYSNIGTQDVSATHLAAITLAIVDQQQGTVDKDTDYYFYTETPVKIIAALTDIKRNFLQSLDEVYVTEKWTALNNAIDVLCTQVDQVLFAISEATDNTAYGTKTHDKMYEFYIYELSKLCCLKGKFAWLKAQMDVIRDNLYRELILSRIIEKHPGAEHMAGVPKGGTFLMVYLGGTEELLEDDSKLSQFDGIVQFDFALPYMCCGSCAPGTVVFNAEPDVTLTISKTKYCLPTDEGQVDFISSIDGVITSPQGDAYIVQTESGYAFDPTAVPNELLGQPLTFLVNGTTPIVPLEICVWKLPTDITPTETFSSWNEAGINLDLNLSHDLESLSFYSYVWNRADGSEIGTTKDIPAAFLANPGQTFEETISVTISITGSPVACTETRDILISYTRPVENSITVPPIICHRIEETSPAWTQILVTPTDAILTSPQDPIDGPSFIEQNENDEYFINPLHVPNDLAGDEIKFAVNGELIENVSTRVAKLPANINTDDFPTHSATWDDTGVNINIRAAHIFQSESYIEYGWIDLDNDGTQIATTNNLPNFRIEDRVGEGVITVNYRLIMRVAGLEDSCTKSFDFNIVFQRPTLEIPSGICFGQSIELDVNPEDVVTTSLDNNVIQNISDTITFESGLVQNNDIGTQIEIFLNGSPVATTTVYKVPVAENITANQEFVRWDGQDVIVSLNASYTVPGVANPENYLEVKWVDGSGNPISEDDLTNYAITTNDGTIETEFKATVCVRANLGVVNPCETVVNVQISYIRPTFDLESGYCYDFTPVGDANDIDIPISSTVELTSQQGSSFIVQEGGMYKFRLSEVPNNLIGQRIGFEIGGVEVAHTFVYKLPTDLNGTHEVSEWNGTDVTVNLVHRYTLPGVTNPQNYLQITWRDENNQIINNTSSHVISAENGRVNKIYTVTVSIDPSLMSTTPCVSTPETVTIIENAPVSTPTDLGLASGYCWKEGDSNLNIRINVSPNDFAITTVPALGTNVFRTNSSSYTFVASSVPNSLLGNLIQFRIDGTTVDNTRVFKLPLESSISHNVPGSRWENGSYLFRIGHNFDDQSYFEYEVFDEQTGQPVEQVEVGVFRVETNDSFSRQYNVRVSVQGLDCSSVAQIVVTAINDDQPFEPIDPSPGDVNLGRLNCDTPYANRLADLGVNTDMQNLETGFANEPFSNDITNNIFDPVENIVSVMRNSRDIVNDSIGAIEEINRLRATLQESYLSDQGFRGDKQAMLKLDESLEIMSLELLRCVDEENPEINGLYNQAIAISNNRAADYGEGSRSKITQTYLETFAGKGEEFKSTIDNTFVRSRR